MEKLTLSLADAERSLLAVRLESEDKDKELVATKVSKSTVCICVEHYQLSMMFGVSLVRT